MFTKKANFVHKICNICRQPFRTKQTAGDEAPAACLKKSHRVHGSQAANQLKSVFCGGVYAAKNTLRASGVSQPRLRRGKARSAAKLSHQFAKWAN
jgi:hypothetical protein